MSKPPAHAPPRQSSISRRNRSSAALQLVGASKASRAPVGVEYRAVEDAGRQAHALANVFGRMVADVAGGAWTSSSAAIPRVELTCGPRERGEATGRIDEIAMVAVIAAEVLAPEPQPGVAGEAPGTVAEPAGIGR